MEIRFVRRFEKKFEKLPSNLRQKTSRVIEIFRKDPFHPSLHNHALAGNLAGRRAISVTNDVRIVLREFEHYTLVLFLDIGTHNQVYS